MNTKTGDSIEIELLVKDGRLAYHGERGSEWTWLPGKVEAVRQPLPGATDLVTPANIVCVTPAGDEHRFTVYEGSGLGTFRRATK